MHELSLCKSIMEIIDAKSKENNFEKVKDIVIEIGGYSCVEKHALEFAFDVVAKGTVAENASITFIDVLESHDVQLKELEVV